MIGIVSVSKISGLMLCNDMKDEVLGFPLFCVDQTLAWAFRIISSVGRADRCIVERST